MKDGRAGRARVYNELFQANQTLAGLICLEKFMYPFTTAPLFHATTAPSPPHPAPQYRHVQATQVRYRHAVQRLKEKNRLYAYERHIHPAFVNFFPAIVSIINNVRRI